MGMYDEISPSLSNRIIKLCPYCGKEYGIEEFWQTKDFDCILKTLTLKDIAEEGYEDFEMHHICPHCNTYISVLANLINGIFRFRSSKVNDYSKWSFFEDTDLSSEYKSLIQDNNIDENFKKCLKSISIGYNKLINNVDLEYDDVYTILHNISKDYYIIPKEKLENI